MAVKPKANKKATKEATKYTAFRCPESILEVAKAKAKSQRRSLSNYLICLVEKDTQDS